MFISRLARMGLAYSGLGGAAIRATKDKIRILMYHGVSVRSLPPNLFESQLRYIARRFDTVWVKELPERLGAGSRRPVIALTFDDGLANNAAIAAPLLAKYGLKATFYLVAGSLEGRGMLWNHELRCRLYLCSGPGMEGVPELPDNPADRWQRVTAFVQSLKKCPTEEVDALLDRVRHETRDMEFDPWMWDEYGLMSAAQARGLPAVVDVGSHTISHCLLDQTQGARLHDEIVGSRHALEDELGRPVETFCYPNGAYHAEARRLVAETYACAVATAEGFASANGDIFALPRIPAATRFGDFVVRLISPSS